MFSFFTGKKNNGSANTASATPNPNISVRSPDEVKDLETLIKTGPVTLVLVHADWCGHCQTYKPVWSELENVPGRTANMAMIHHDMVEKSPTLKNAKIPGYPTVLKVYQNGHIEEYKEEEKGKTNALPNMRDMTIMKKEITSPVIPKSIVLQNTRSRSNVSNSPQAVAAAISNPGMTANVKNSASIKAVVPGAPGMPSKLPANITNPGLSSSAVPRLSSNSSNPGLSSTAVPRLSSNSSNPGLSSSAVPKLPTNSTNPGFTPSVVSQIAKRNINNVSANKSGLVIGATQSPNIRRNVQIPPLKGGSLMHVLGRALIQAGPASLLFAAQQSFPTKKGRGSTLRLTRKSRPTSKGRKSSSNKAIRSKTRKN